MRWSLPICLHCKYYRQTSFFIGECGFRKIVWGESFPLYTSDYHRCPEWKLKEELKKEANQ